MKKLPQQSQKVDFLLYIGSDSSNEPVYEYLHSNKVSLNVDHKKYVCVLGKKPSKAQYYVES